MEQRTPTQNRALHLWFRRLAEALNEAGLDMKHTLKPEVEIPWDEHTIKQFLWKPIQELAVGKKSTTELETKEVSRIYDIMNRHLGEKFGIYVAFPNEEEAP